MRSEPRKASAPRLGYRSGYYSRTLVTRVGKLELRVPQDRDGRFSTELFERYQRSEQALVATLAEMYGQGVSTRKVKAITEELCGHAFSASAVSAIPAAKARGRTNEGEPRLIHLGPPFGLPPNVCARIWLLTLPASQIAGGAH